MSENSGIFPYSESKDAMKQAKFIVVDEKPGHDSKYSTDQNLALYEEYFGCLDKSPLKILNKPRIITEHLHKMKEQNHNCIVLDLAGGEGVAVRDMSRLGLIKSGLVTALSDVRDEEQKDYDNNHEIGFVSGDLFRRNTWNQIKKWLQEQGREGFDLITALPVSAYRQRITSDRYNNMIPPESYGVLLKRAISLLNPHGGMLLAQVPAQLYSSSLYYVPDKKRAQKNLKDFEGFLSSLKSLYPNMSYNFQKDLSLWNIDPEFHAGVVTPSHCGFVKITLGKKITSSTPGVDSY